MTSGSQAAAAPIIGEDLRCPGDRDSVLTNPQDKTPVIVAGAAVTVPLPLRIVIGSKQKPAPAVAGRRHS
jgi:hypothetical protein